MAQLTNEGKNYGQARLRPPQGGGLLSHVTGGICRRFKSLFFEVEAHDTVS